MKKIFFRVVFFVCAIIGVMLISRTNWVIWVKNNFSHTGEIVRFIFVGGNQSLVGCEFGPTDFSFVNTGMVYRAQFRPCRAVPHEVVIQYPFADEIRWKSNKDVVRGMQLRVMVRQGGYWKEIKTANPEPVICGVNGVDGRHVCHIIASFCPGFGCFDSIGYDEEVLVEVKLLASPEKLSYLRFVKPKLLLREGFALE